jgi:transcription initiation factor TFIIIB Brf1 subunit/transcription initiation factor TFIIB
VRARAERFERERRASASGGALALSGVACSMKGSFVHCRFCNSTDLKVNRANETIQCENCDRILEERYNDFRVQAINIERESPFCVVTNDELANHKFEGTIEGDPFHSSGLITAFSHLTVQQQGAFTLTARTFPGDLAELERILADLDMDGPLAGPSIQLRAEEELSRKECKTEGTPSTAADDATIPAAGAAATSGAPATVSAGMQVNGEVGRSSIDGRFMAISSKAQRHCKEQSRSNKLRHVLVAYFMLLDVSFVLPVTRDDVDEALRLFNKYCEAAPNIRSKNVESLAIAALILVLRRQPTARGSLDLPDFAAASGQPQKDLIQGIKNIQQGLDSRLASSCSSISSHMPHFCAVLGMQGAAEKLAIELGENAMLHNVCSRRNPMSIAAAAIYLACNLEDQKKTQTEICKVTGLTEVTLRKVYKELLVEHAKVIPSSYVSKVRLQTLLPGPVPASTKPKAAASTWGDAASASSSMATASDKAAGECSTAAHAVQGKLGGSAAAALTAGVRAGDDKSHVQALARDGPTMLPIPAPAEAALGAQHPQMQVPLLHQHMMAMGQAAMIGREHLNLHHHMAAMAAQGMDANHLGLNMALHNPLAGAQVHYGGQMPMAAHQQPLVVMHRPMHELVERQKRGKK